MVVPTVTVSVVYLSGYLWAAVGAFHPGAAVSVSLEYSCPDGGPVGGQRSASAGSDPFAGHG